MKGKREEEKEEEGKKKKGGRDSWDAALGREGREGENVEERVEGEEEKVSKGEWQVEVI